MDLNSFHPDISILSYRTWLATSISKNVYLHYITININISSRYLNVFLLLVSLNLMRKFEQLDQIVKIISRCKLYYMLFRDEERILDEKEIYEGIVENWMGDRWKWYASNPNVFFKPLESTLHFLPSLASIQYQNRYFTSNSNSPETTKDRRSIFIITIRMIFYPIPW